MLDPITFQVIVSRLSGIVQEMQDSIFRTGYSTIVRESHDASCVLLDAAGDVVGEHVVAPLHLTSLPRVVRAIKDRFGDDIHRGDAFITNHPYVADVTHSIDMAVVTPVFHGDRLIAYCGSIAHKSDLGGVFPGTANGSARELFQEGTLYPPIRYLRGGAVVRDVDAILRANSRTPETILGDIRGQIGVAHLGERRLLETVDRYGLAVVLEVFEAKQAATERRLRREFAAWPDGSAEGASSIDDAGTPGAGIRYHVRVTKRGDRIGFDFSGSSDQTTMPINVRPSIVRGCCYYILMGMVDPTIENNGGFDRVVDLTIRPGSILDPIYPAPTNSYMATAIAVCEALIAALSGLRADLAVAEVGGVGGGLSFGGRRAGGAAFTTYENVGSAYGARTGKDGISGIGVLLSNAKTAPIEIMESEYPLRVRRFELLPDSGGAGTFRGGLGPVREYELLAAAQMTLRGGKHEIPAGGVQGGGAARTGAAIVNPGTDSEQRLPSRISGVQLRPHDVLRLEKSGGGGLGPAAERPFAKIVDDVLDGYVSREAAIGTYGIDPARLDDALRSASGSPVCSG